MLLEIAWNFNSASAGLHLQIWNGRGEKTVKGNLRIQISEVKMLKCKFLAASRAVDFSFFSVAGSDGK